MNSPEGVEPSESISHNGWFRPLARPAGPRPITVIMLSIPSAGPGLWPGLPVWENSQAACAGPGLGWGPQGPRPAQGPLAAWSDAACGPTVRSHSRRSERDDNRLARPGSRCAASAAGFASQWQCVTGFRRTVRLGLYGSELVSRCCGTKRSGLQVKQVVHV